MPKRLLLVGPEPMKLREAPDLRPTLGAGWEVVTASACPQAFDILYRDTVDTVVVDARLPGTTGTQFLDAVMAEYPQVLRFLMADLTDKQMILKCLGTAHQFLSKPCDSKKLAAALDRARQLELLFANDRARAIVGGMSKLPSPPSSYFQIVRELQSPHASLENIGAIVSRDPAITAKLLQLVNSAAFGLKREVAAPGEAVMFLGLETTKSLVLLAHSYSHFDAITSTQFSVDALWRHSLLTGRVAREVARSEDTNGDLAEEAFTAGLLHDIGKLLLAANHPTDFNRVYSLSKEKSIALWEAEQEIFGATHAEVGAWLIAIWGLPVTIVEALALHHLPTPLISQSFSPLTAVHVANVMENVLEKAPGTATMPDLAYLAGLGLDKRYPDWQRFALPEPTRAAA